MKRYSSAPCLMDGNGDSKKAKSVEEPNAREYLQLALARVLELQREIKEGTYTSDRTSDLGESSSEEDLTKEVIRKVFEDLPGTPDTVGKIVERMTKPNNSQLDAIHGFRLGTYSRNEPRMAHRRTGLRKSSICDQEIRDRMLRSLDLHLANKQRDYTAKLMRLGM
ncbi:uncharacterized protein LOC122716182 isoform X2 [Apis laboriosa]|uniref:uncharacterized protein LOC122716182 isoform X2 n=1 Tax=Apis laboriosa TaxID=183418 RepID=UPI001CC3846C|nr:uncharacterized protein LOC122716182 isoform X2 [Apis laboriosa]